MSISNQMSLLFPIPLCFNSLHYYVMAKLPIIFSLLAIISLQTLVFPGEGWTFTLVNNCSYTVWPASETSTIGFSLEPGASNEVESGPNNNGRLWGRTLCDNSTGKLSCKTGDSGATTLFEFSNGLHGEDIYDISLVNGYNLPILVVPKSAPGCAATGCIFDVDGACPSELKLNGTCRSACGAFGTARYCCMGAYNNLQSCKPTNYSRVFKKACPRAYSYAYDTKNDTFSCLGAPSYTITFCPSPRALTSAFSATPRSSLLSPPSPYHSQRGNSKERRRKQLLHISLVVAIPIMAAIMLCLLCFGTGNCLRKRKAMERHNDVEIDDIRTAESLHFDLSTIRASTTNFSSINKLGQGGFGEVYKGKFESGQEVAIKRLSATSGQGVAEFRTEVGLVAKLQHKNLVKLLGFCVTSKEKILVYEYLPNSSLDKFLFDSTKNSVLDWQTRLDIMVGIARGLQYLHEDSRLKVIHRDLKTSNILLDEAMNPKISDFGLAKLFGADQTQGDTNKIVGTYGYMAPEYAITGHYSVKSDVYSFGVIVLEIVSGQKNRFFGRMHLDEEPLLCRAWRLWNEAKPLDLVDTLLSDDLPGEEVVKCIHIGLLCIQENAAERPGMTFVVAALSGQPVNLPMPKPPRFFDGASNIEHNGMFDNQSSSYSYTGGQTITDVYPRG